MHLPHLTLLLFLHAALPSLAEDFTPSDPSCLTSCDARRVAQNFRALIHAYTPAAADAYLTPDFTDYSDSVNELINSGCPNGSQPLGSATFTSLAGFKAGQGAQPPIPFTLLDIWHGCRAVTIRWRSARPGVRLPEQQVTGIAVLETVYGGHQPASAAAANCSATGAVAKASHRISRVFSEFNSGAWLWDIGASTSSCAVGGSSNVTVSANGSAASSVAASTKVSKERRARVRI